MTSSSRTRILRWRSGVEVYLLAQHVEMAPTHKVWLIAGTAFIPIIFWCMDFQWRTHLRYTCLRGRVISLFINSPQFEFWCDDALEDSAKPKAPVRFPVHDPVGLIYTTQESTKGFENKYLVIEALEMESTIKDVGKCRKPQLFKKMDVGKTQSEKLIYSVWIISWLVLPFILRASTAYSFFGY